MNKQSFVFGMCAFALVLFCAGRMVVADTNSDDCSRFEMRQQLLGEADLSAVEDLTSLFEGELFFRDKIGACGPTNDAYLVGVLYGSYPQILEIFPHGHTPSAKIHRFGEEDVLLVFYTAGANTYVLRPYKFVVASYGFIGLNPIEAEGRNFVSSNIRSIEAEGDTVVVRNSIWLEGKPHGAIVSESYLYQDGKFSLVAKETEESE